MYIPPTVPKAAALANFATISFLIRTICIHYDILSRFLPQCNDFRPAFSSSALDPVQVSSQASRALLIPCCISVDLGHRLLSR